MNGLIQDDTDTDTLPLYRDSVATFLRKELLPNIDEWRKRECIPPEFFRRAGESGLLCPSVPVEYGGAGGNFHHNAIVIEEVARAGMCPALLTVHSDIVPAYLLNWGTEAQKLEWLPKLVAGSTIAAIAMTEPGAGSDLQGIRTTDTTPPGSKGSAVGRGRPRL